MNTLSIDIVSDIVCPWCVIGYRKLCLTMQDLKEEVGFNIHWKAYQLHPEISKEGFDKEEYKKIKFGDPNISRDRIDLIAEEGKKVLRRKFRHLKINFNNSINANVTLMLT